jgi:uncharacterized 2Fe-2S/4Fe-4S cluster protein (DUF4445 family)
VTGIVTGIVTGMVTGTVTGSSQEQHRVVFTPSGRGGVAAEGTTVLDAARGLGVDLDSVCGGRGICGRCTVEPAVGSFPKWNISAPSDAFGPLTSLELAYHQRKGLAPTARLGCQIHITADAVIEIPTSSQVHRPVVRKGVNLTDLVVDPMISLHFVEVPAAYLGDDRSAVERLQDTMAERGIASLEVPLRLLPSIHRALGVGALSGESEGTTVAVKAEGSGHRAVAVYPGFVESAFGVAIDIGSTTVAGHLCDLRSGEVLSSAGAMNPQIRFGEDLMSRVSYVMMNPGGDVALTSAIRSTLNELISTLIAGAPSSAGVTSQLVLDVVLVSNPVMHHIALGIDPTPLGGAPFELAISAAVHATATELDLALPFADLYFAPCIAGHVGADTASAILSEKPHGSEEVQLLIDVGTNAEIVLGNSDRQYAASSPTGPAFEGAQISCGQRATTGAIERVRIDRATFEPLFKVIGSDLWSNETGFDEAISELDVQISGVCGSGIIEVMGELFLSGLIRTDGTFDPSATDRTPRLVEDGRTLAYILHDGSADGGPVLRITQNDIRAIQLAKAALRAGIDLLSAHAKFERIDTVRLAGAFGAHIDPVYAMVLGLVPDGPVESVASSGNSAGSGAVRALLSAAERAEMETVVRGVIKIETATEPAFQELFVNAMGFPHSTEPTPMLATVVDLPAPSAGSSVAASSRRRRQTRTTTGEQP